MLAGLLFAAAGQVIEPGLVRAPGLVDVGDTLVVRRLEPSVGAPGRPPFFQWAEAAKLRVTALRPDGTAEVALVRGRVRPGDRVSSD